MLKSFIHSSALRFALLFLSADVALAAPRDEGESAFQAGDYAAAAALFEQAIAEGDDSNATRYNLAASYFRQGDTAKANANFRMLYDLGFRSADVLYSLAVTEKRLGNTDAAVELFSTVAVNTSALADEALAQLEELGVDPVVTMVTPGGFVSSVQVATGYNDALVEVQDGQLVREGDTYAETYATLAWQRPFANPWGLEVNLALYNNTYAETEGQNFSLVSAGLQQTRALFGQQVFWTIDLDASQLDDHGFQQSLNAGAGFEQRGTRSHWRVGYRYRDSVSLNTAFDPYAGQHHRVYGEFDLQLTPRHQLSLHAFHEHIDREAVSNSQSMLDLSRKLWRMDVGWAWQLNSVTLVTAGANYGGMHADAYQRFNDGTVLEREEDNLGFALGLRRNLTPRLMVQLSYNHSDNDSTLADFTYDQAISEIGFIWTPAL